VIVALRYAAQALLYAAFAAFIGYFSTSPHYQQLPPGQALLKLSLAHAGQLKEDCRKRTPEELARLAPNMRAQTVCPRERMPVTVEVIVDGDLLFRVVASPSGLARDGASTMYRRVAIVAGAHHVMARMADGPDGAFRVSADATIQLAPGNVMVIDYAPQDGFVFRGSSIRG
jgi:hypothetical protein